MENDSADYTRLRDELATVRRHLRLADATSAAVIHKLNILREAGLAVVARWDSPLWKDAAPTAEIIDRLRKALESDNG